MCRAHAVAGQHVRLFVSLRAMNASLHNRFLQRVRSLAILSIVVPRTNVPRRGNDDTARQPDSVLLDAECDQA